MGISVPSVGRIVLDGDDVLPLRLLDLDGACIIEIVDGQYRVEKLEGEADVKD